MWPMLIAAGLGLGKSELVDRPQEQKDRALAAETARWSPWTNMKPEAVKKADPFGSVLQYGTTGAMMGQNMNNQDAYRDYLKTSGMKAPPPGNAWSGMQVAGPNPYGSYV